MNTLQKTLRTNALFSGISGIILLIFNKVIAQVFGTTNHTVFLIVGIALIYFAGTIGYEIKKQRKSAIQWIIIQDFIWVVASIVLIIFNPFQSTQKGILIIGIVAIIVLYMGVRQKIALNKIVDS
jgi:hypothetical protein